MLFLLNEQFSLKISNLERFICYMKIFLNQICAFWMHIKEIATFVEKMQKIEFFSFDSIDFKFEMKVLQYNPNIPLKYLVYISALSIQNFDLNLYR